MGGASSRGRALWGAGALIGGFMFVLIREVLQISATISPLVFETFAAILGAVITVAAMAIMMRFQAEQDKHREFSAHVFENKLKIYLDLLNVIFKSDDDEAITLDEIQEIENRIGTASLLAGERLVSILSQYMYQFKIYGVPYLRKLDSQQLEHFIAAVEHAKTLATYNDSFLAAPTFELDLPVRGNEAEYFMNLDDLIEGMRHDLDVVEGSVKQSVEHFTMTPYDNFGLIRASFGESEDPSPRRRGQAR